MTILDEIVAHKRSEIAAARLHEPDAVLAARAEAVSDPTRGLRRSIETGTPPRIIAEIKRRSPSRGEIRSDFDPAAIAKDYLEGGAAALSVLTDEHYFGGRIEYLATARAAASLPILRKDFIVESRQIDEARVAGADAVLLIVAALAPRALEALHGRALAVGLDVLVEVHDEAELDTALAAGAKLVGINNRDLRSFAVDLGVTERLAPRAPQDVVIVAESGIMTSADVRRLSAAGARAFLVGESLMREPDPGLALRRLREAS
ncbi:MAG: indole-3-glycerol phosphate synthase TrpC [Deltaproteobacteria bacterium]|nr:indole-3-glycerol phosphate synthase TrpC [Deltaproteobacteria bacterium]